MHYALFTAFLVMAGDQPGYVDLASLTGNPWVVWHCNRCWTQYSVPCLVPEALAELGGLGSLPAQRVYCELCNDDCTQVMLEIGPGVYAEPKAIEDSRYDPEYLIRWRRDALERSAQLKLWKAEYGVATPAPHILPPFVPPPVRYMCPTQVYDGAGNDNEHDVARLEDLDDDDQTAEPAEPARTQVFEDSDTEPEAAD